MALTEKGQIWVPYDEVEGRPGDPGVVRKILAYCDEVMCVEHKFEQGARGMLHSHPHTQITYVAEGVFEFTIGGETRVVKKGDTLLKQHGVEHGCVCLEAGILFDVFAPMREDFIAALKGEE